MAQVSVPFHRTDAHPPPPTTHIGLESCSGRFRQRWSEGHSGGQPTPPPLGSGSGLSSAAGPLHHWKTWTSPSLSKTVATQATPVPFLCPIRGCPWIERSPCLIHLHPCQNLHQPPQSQKLPQPGQEADSSAVGPPDPGSFFPVFPPRLESGCHPSSGPRPSGHNAYAHGSHLR